jgi:hypothetical protein
MFAILLGVLIGVYLDQLLTIPPLNDYIDMMIKYIDENRNTKMFVTASTSKPEGVKDD